MVTARKTVGRIGLITPTWWSAGCRRPSPPPTVSNAPEAPGITGMPALDACVGSACDGSSLSIPATCCRWSTNGTSPATGTPCTIKGGRILSGDNYLQGMCELDFYIPPPSNQYTLRFVKFTSIRNFFRLTNTEISRYEFRHCNSEHILCSCVVCLFVVSPVGSRFSGV